MKNIRTILRILVLLVVLGVIVYVVYRCTSTKDDKEEVRVTSQMILKEVEALGRLEVVKYTIQNMMEYEKVRTWLPNSKAALIISGEVIGCIDLTKIEEGDIQNRGDTVYIQFPAPEICVVKIDHSKSKVYDVNYGLWEEAKIVDAAYAYAERELKREADKMGIFKEAEENTRKALTPILAAMGIKNVVFSFKGHSYDALMNPIENNSNLFFLK